MSDRASTALYALALRQKNRKWAAALALAVATCVAVLVFAGALNPLDRWFYDLALHSAAPLRPAPKAAPNPDAARPPLLIEINEASLAALGRWPWPRSVHAKLLDTLAAAPPKVVGFDIVFAQPELHSVASAATDADALFASAINRASFPVILAAMYERVDASVGGRTKIIRPEPPLDQSAARLAHIHAHIDSDGAVRSLYLQEGFAGYVPLPYLGYALHTPRAAQRSDAGLAPLPSLAGAEHADNAADVWQLQRSVFLYPMADSAFERVSYSDIVAGQVSPEFWRGRTVLVSTTAAGLGDQYVSPVYRASTVMAGGEIVLSLLHTLRLHDQGLPMLHWASAAWTASAAVLVCFVLMLGLRVLSLQRQWMLLVACLLLSLGFSALVFARLGWFVSPAASLLAVFLAFSAWQLLRLQAVLSVREIGTESKHILGHLLPANASHDFPPESLDPVDAHLLRLAKHNETQLATRNTLTAVLQVLPDAAFVLAPQADGHSGVWLANEAALRLIAQHLPNLGALLPSYLRLMQPFQALLTSNQLTALAGNPFHWQLLLRRNLPIAFAAGVAARATDGTRFLVKSQALQSSDVGSNSATLLPSQGFVLSLLDLSVSQQLTAQRDASLQFLSHDLRSPPAAILAMLELESARYAVAAPLLNRIGNAAQRTLYLAEGFVQLSRAEQSEIYTFSPYDLNDLAVEAADELWAPAKQRGIRIHTALHDDALLINADRTMLWRAVVNLLSNAVRHSPENAHITVTTLKTPLGAALHIQDAGAGIPPSVLARLFQRFAQGESISHSRPQGAGLGLALVKTVLEHHAGEVRAVSPCESLPAPHGTRFELSLPLLAVDPA